jgi:formamidopyrimidine-DNA glycosylase
LQGEHPPQELVAPPAEARRMSEQTDPFVEEAERHGWQIRETYQYTRSTVARDACRAYAEGEMCDRCDDLIKAFDDALFGAFVGGTGPWA